MMQEEHKAILRNNRLYLSGHLNPDTLEDHIGRVNLLTKRQWKSFLEGSSEERNAALIDALLLKDATDFEKFVTIVKQTHPIVAAKLDFLRDNRDAFSSGYNNVLPSQITLRGERAALSKKLAVDLDHFSVCWISGPPGCGKSALAVAASHLLARKSKYVIYVDARQFSQLSTLIDELLGIIKFKIIETKLAKDKSLITALHNLGSSVLCLDNCDSLLKKEGLLFENFLTEVTVPKQVGCIMSSCFCPSSAIKLELETFQLVSVDFLNEREAIDLLSWSFSDHKGGLEVISEEKHDILEKISSLCWGMPLPLLIIGRKISLQTHVFLQNCFDCLKPKERFLENFYNSMVSGKEFMLFLDDHLKLLCDDNLWSLLQRLAIFPTAFSLSFASHILGIRDLEYSDRIEMLKKRNLLHENADEMLSIPELFRQHLMIMNETDQRPWYVAASQRYSNHMKRVICRIADDYEANHIKMHRFFRDNKPKIIEFFSRKIEKHDLTWYRFAKVVIQSSCPIFDENLPLSALSQFYENAAGFAEVQEKESMWKAAFSVSWAAVLLESFSYNLEEKELQAVRRKVEEASFIEQEKRTIPESLSFLEKRYWKAKAGVEIASGNGPKAVTVFEAYLLNSAIPSFDDWSLLAKAYRAAASVEKGEALKSCFGKAAACCSAALANVHAVQDRTFEKAYFCLSLAFKMRMGVCLFEMGNYKKAKEIFEKFLSGSGLSEGIAGAAKKDSCYGFILHSKALAHLGADIDVEGKCCLQDIRRCRALLIEAERSYKSQHFSTLYPIKLVIHVAIGKALFIQGVITSRSQSLDPNKISYFNRAKSYFSDVRKCSVEEGELAIQTLLEEASYLESFLSDCCSKPLKDLLQSFLSTFSSQTKNSELDDSTAFDALFGGLHFYGNLIDREVKSFFDSSSDDDVIACTESEEHNDVSEMSQVSEEQEEIRSAYGESSVSDQDQDSSGRLCSDFVVL